MKNNKSNTDSHAKTSMVEKQPKQENKKKSNMILVVILVSIICFVLIVGFAYFIGIQHSGSDNSKKVESKSIVKEASNEFDISVEEQYKDVLKRYFNYDSIFVDEYDNLGRFPVAYKDVMVHLWVHVKKVLEDDGTNYKILVYVIDNDYDYDDEIEANDLVIEGKYENGKRYLEGDYLDVYGIYKGISSYTIKGDKKVLPMVKTDKIVVSSGQNLKTLFDENDIRNVAQYFFNTKDFTLIKPNYDYNNSKEAELMELPFHYILKLDNSTNSKFNEYRMYVDFGYIEVATEKESGKVKRYINKTSDGNNFILVSYTEDNNRLEFQIYDDSFNQIWSREFTNVENYNWDANNGLILLNINTDLYYINETDGKDVIEPIMIGESLNMKLLANGDCIIVSKKKSDFVMYIDKNGKVKWKTGINVNPEQVTDIITANNKIYVSYKSDASDDSVTSVYDTTGKLIVNTYES